MLYTKFEGRWPAGFGEIFLRVFTIYGHGGHLGHMTQIIWTNFYSPIPLRLDMKFGFDWPSSFWDVEECGRWKTEPASTISSPMSLKFVSGRAPSAAGNESDCESRGRWFEPWPGHILSWIFFMAILPLLLIQEWQLSASGRSMCTKY